MVIPGNLIFLYTIRVLQAGHTTLTLLFTSVYLLAGLIQVHFYFIASDLEYFALINSEGAIFLHFLPYANFRGVAAWHVQLVPYKET